MAIDEITAESQPTGVRYWVLLWLCLAAAIAYLHRNAIAVTTTPIQKELGLSLEEMGWALSGFYLTYALFQIPTGWLGDRWGSRRALTAYSAVWSLATGVTAAATGLTAVMAARLGAGAAQAGIFPCSANTLAQWFPRVRRGMASGLLSSCMSAGGFAASALTGALLAWMSWRWIFGVYILPGLVWSLGFYAWFRDSPREHLAVNEDELRLIREGTQSEENDDKTSARAPVPWGRMALSPAMWFLCGQQFFRAAGYIFFASWFPKFLQETRGVSVPESGLLNSLPLLAVVVGAPLGGVFIDWLLARTGSRRISYQLVAAASMLACAVLILAAYGIHDTLLAVLVISAGSFCAAFGGPSGYTVTIEMGGRHVATVFSTMNMSGNLGAAAFPLVVAKLVVLSGGWHYVLFLFSALYVAACGCWLLLNPSGTVFD